MMKVILNIVIITLLAISIVLVLLFLNYYTYENYTVSDRFYLDSPQLEYRAENIDGCMDICGFSDSGIFLSKKSPNSLIFIDYTLNFKESIPINFDKDQVNRIKNIFFIRTMVPNIYIFCGNLSTVFISSIHDHSVKQFETGNTFTRGTIISEDTIILRIVDLKLKDQIFAKFQTSIGKVSTEKNISQLIGDGGISNSGILHFDNVTNKIVYTPFFKNKVLIFDLNLKNPKYLTTIVSSNKPIPVTEVDKNNHSIITTSKPNRVIHGSSSVDNGMLYINSSVESGKLKDGYFRKRSKNSIIDIYRIESNEYMGSFSLPIPNEELLSISVRQNNLYALSKSALERYQINQLYFNPS